MQAFYLALAAFVGGIIAALLGWLESQDSFQPKKFLASLCRALVAAAAAFAAAYYYSNEITPVEIAAVFVSGAGFDVLGNRGYGAVKALLNKET